ncbi:hypothetical protein [Actinomadura rupiterrae]|uniref:hypothetical protein n=1 Tax=Actinomadura rupiterrae TaxID=559627 RepID=UPI0020A5E10C|nr:hypothetical protein [Actinomadura rupiterrae]MCP2342931.1 hypothetical protein [Actinomadura rupiterrae]
MTGSHGFDAQMSGDGPASQGLRFGFYRPVSYLRRQIPVDHWNEQNTAAVEKMIAAAHGRMVDTYLEDISSEDHARPGPWGQRLLAKKLLTDLAADTLDAVAVCTVARGAFAATPVWDVVMLLACQGKQLWSADIGGPLDPRNPEHILWLKVKLGVPEPNPALLTTPTTAMKGGRA